MMEDPNKDRDFIGEMAREIAWGAFITVAFVVIIAGLAAASGGA